MDEPRFGGTLNCLECGKPLGTVLVEETRTAFRRVDGVDLIYHGKIKCLNCDDVREYCQEEQDA